MNKNTNFFERLEAIADHFGLAGIPGLGKVLKYKSAEKLYRLSRNREAKPSIDIILDLANKFESLNIEWFLTGKGAIEKEKAEAREPQSAYSLYKPVTPEAITLEKSREDTIVLVPKKDAARYLTGYRDSEYLQSLATYHFPKLTQGIFRMFEVLDQSMYPTIHQGSFVVGEWVENWVQNIKDDCVYILVSKVDGIAVKRVLNSIDINKSLYCKSDNQREYPSITLNPKDMLEVWEVKLHLSFKIPNPSEVYNRLNDLEVKLMHLEQRFDKK